MIFPRVTNSFSPGAAATKFEAIVEAQGRRPFPDPAAFKEVIGATRAGHITSIDCRGINALAKLAGAPAHPAAGLRVLRKPGDAVTIGEPILEVHAESPTHLELVRNHATEHPEIFHVVE